MKLPYSFITKISITYNWYKNQAKSQIRLSPVFIEQPQHVLSRSSIFRTKKKTDNRWAWFLFLLTSFFHTHNNNFSVCKYLGDQIKMKNRHRIFYWSTNQQWSMEAIFPFPSEKVKRNSFFDYLSAQLIKKWFSIPQHLPSELIRQLKMLSNLFVCFGENFRLYWNRNCERFLNHINFEVLFTL